MVALSDFNTAAVQTILLSHLIFTISKSVHYLLFTLGKTAPIDLFKMSLDLIL